MQDEQINKFRKELLIRRYAQSTIDTYCACLTTIFHRCGSTPTLTALKELILTIENRNYHKQIVATARNYFEFVLGVKLNFSDLPYPRKSSYMPVVFSIQEMKSLFSQVKNLKHRTIISLLYGCGLRVGEVINLKPEDIDRSRMVINIRSGKGNKDRQVPLDPVLLKTLEDYYREFMPVEYLFNGQFSNVYTESSINQFLKYYAQKAGISKSIHAHLLRHSFAVHLLESGTDMAIIQKLLGHANIKTTQGYARISTSLISKVRSPLNFVA